MGRILNKYRIISTGILLGLVAVIYMVGLRKDPFLERGETKKRGWETTKVVDMEEEERSPWLLANDKGLEEADTEAGRMYPPTNPIGGGVGFLARKDIVTSRENENPGVPEELTQTLSTTLQNNSLEDYVAGISASYVLLQAGEIMQYIREDTSGILESFYFDYSKGGEEWFLFERDNDIIVRQEIDNEEYPYCYYKFRCKGNEYEDALCAYGKNEDYFFISWDDDDYLVVTKRKEGEVNGIAVYQMYGDSLIGWILGLEKASDGEVEVSYYTYVTNGSHIQGTPFLDY